MRETNMERCPVRDYIVFKEKGNEENNTGNTCGSDDSFGVCFG